MQIFVKNNMQWFAPPLQEREVNAFREHPSRHSLRCIFGHSGYLINLAARDPFSRELDALVTRSSWANQQPSLSRSNWRTWAGVERTEKVVASLTRYA
jgi:hypothetical protein